MSIRDTWRWLGAETIKEPIVAWRGWNFCETSEKLMLLRSVVNRDYIWTPFEPAAGSVDGRHGIHAYKSREDAAGKYAVWGSVYLWGKIAEHERGYRAEFAYPKELWAPLDEGDLARLRDNYGVPVHQQNPFDFFPVTRASGGFSIPQVLEVFIDTLYDRDVIESSGYVRLFYKGMALNPGKTNMHNGGWLQSPTKMLVQGMRCTVLERGALVPITDPVYWDTIVRVVLMNKLYWESPLAVVVDPAAWFAAGDFSKLPPEIQTKLAANWSSQFTGTLDPSGLNLPPKITGLLIESQMPFSVDFIFSRPQPDREISCVLLGGRVVAVV